MLAILKTVSMLAATFITTQLAVSVGNAAWDVVEPFWDELVKKMSPDPQDLEDLRNVVREKEEELATKKEELKNEK